MLVNVQDSGLEVGTATQEATHFPQVGLIPYRYIPSSCADTLLSAMNSKTRQAFRAVSSSSRQSVHAYTTSLSLKSSQYTPRQLEEFSVPKCPNIRSLDIHHFRSFEGPVPASAHSLKATAALYELLCNGALLKCTELEELTLHGCQSLEQMPPSPTGFSKLLTLKIVECYQLIDVSVLGSCPNLQTLNLSGGARLVDVSALSLS
eukprot:gene22817-biopygen31464